MCDASEGVAEQDAKILGLAEERGARHDHRAQQDRPARRRTSSRRLEESAREKLSFAPYVPIVMLERQDGARRPELFETIDAVREAYTKRVGTGELNRFFETVLDTAPAADDGRQARRASTT